MDLRETQEKEMQERSALCNHVPCRWGIYARLPIVEEKQVDNDPNNGADSMKDQFVMLNNAIRDLMCDRCAPKVRRDCFNQPGETARTRSMIQCMEKILKPEDDEYPTKFRKVVE